jgi:hypothetical protein
MYRTREDGGLRRRSQDAVPNDTEVRIDHEYNNCVAQCTQTLKPLAVVFVKENAKGPVELQRTR